MKIYRVRCGDGFQWLLPANEEDYDLLRFDGSLLSPAWHSLKMKHLLRLDDRSALLEKRGDFPGGTGGGVFSQSAKDKIGSLLEKFGELLPLIAEGGEPYWAFNVTHFVDALDEPHSKLLHASDTGEVLMINKHAFIPAALVGEQIFKLPQMKRGRFYVTDAFVDMARSNDLKGMDFVPVWELKAN